MAPSQRCSLQATSAGLDPHALLSLYHCPKQAVPCLRRSTTPPYLLMLLLLILAVLLIISAVSWRLWRSRALAVHALAPAPSPVGFVDATRHAKYLHLTRQLAAATSASSGDSSTSSWGGLYLPIAYSQADMAYVLPARIGKHILNLVLDTGSYCLSVAHAECVANGGCRVPDARGYHALPSTSRGTAAFPTNATLTTLPYATLDMDVHPARDDIVLVNSTDTLHTLTDVAFYTARSMRGTASHIAGLARPAHISPACDALLDAAAALLPSKGAHEDTVTWGLAASAASGEGTLWVSRHHQRPPALQTLDWHKVPLLPEAVTSGFYMVHVRRIGVRRVDGGAPTIQWLNQASTSAARLLIDTGTAETYFPPHLARVLNSSGVPLGLSARTTPQQAPTIVFDLLPSLQLEYSGQRYIVDLDGTPLHSGRDLGRSTFHAYTPEIEAILAPAASANNMPTILFGIAHMQDMAWEFPWRAPAPQFLHVAQMPETM